MSECLNDMVEHAERNQKIYDMINNDDKNCTEFNEPETYLKFLGVNGNWKDVYDSAMTTIDKESDKEPSSSWKERMLFSEHSPIRMISFKAKWYFLKYFVHTHFRTHKIGIEHFVKSSRDDITGIKRSTISQEAPVNHKILANMQAIINISQFRLCYKADKETIKSWRMFLDSFKNIEPELYRMCVKRCVYRNGLCPEMKSCGYNHTKEFENELKEYIKPINHQINRNTSILNSTCITDGVCRFN
ncbi:MAG: hypothetical protein ACM3O3_12550 [Syntrophothermus sp.]